MLVWFSSSLSIWASSSLTRDEADLAATAAETASLDSTTTLASSLPSSSDVASLAV